MLTFKATFDIIKTVKEGNTIKKKIKNKKNKKVLTSLTRDDIIKTEKRKGNRKVKVKKNDEHNDYSKQGKRKHGTV